MLKLIASIGLAITLFMLIPLLVGLARGEPVAAFALFVVLYGGGNSVLFLWYRHQPLTLSLKEGILGVNLVWLTLGLVGTVPFVLYTSATSAEAFFEAVSGFTTTGATVFSDIEALPGMLLIWRSLMHWIGGMGIIVLGIGLLPFVSPSGSLGMFRAETTGVKIQKVTPKIRDTALRLWAIYVVLTAGCALAYLAEGMTLFDAINHAMSTIATGGFSTRNDSFGAYADQPLILWTAIFFMIVSGINFIAHLKLLNRDTGGYTNEETRWYLRTFVVLSVLTAFYLFFRQESRGLDALTHAFFTIAAVMTTTGFASVDYGAWGSEALVIVLVAMLASSSAGSTAGGIKMMRWVIVFRAVIREVKRIFQPDALLKLSIDGALLSERILLSAFGVFSLFAFTVLLSAFYLFARGYDALTSISTALACTANIGPGLGLSGPAHHYGVFEDMDLVVLCVVMIAGRLEFFTLVLLLSRSFWKRF